MPKQHVNDVLEKQTQEQEMAYYVRRYLDGSRHVVRVRDGISDILRGMLGKLKDVIGRAIAFSISKLQGTGIGRKIASMLQRVFDLLMGSAREATAAENGNGDLGAARKNLIEALKGLRKVKETAERTDLPADVQLGIKSPIENATRLMETLSKDFSLQWIIDKVKNAQQANSPRALTYDPLVRRPIVPGDVSSMMPQRNIVKEAILKRVGQIPVDVPSGFKNAITGVVSRIGNSFGMNNAADRIRELAKEEISGRKRWIVVNPLNLGQTERKAFNSGVNNVNKYSESVIDLIRKFSGHTGDVVPHGTRLFEKKVIEAPNGITNGVLRYMRQGALPF